MTNVQSAPVIGGTDDHHDNQDYAPVRYTQEDLDEDARAMMQEIAAMDLQRGGGGGGGGGGSSRGSSSSSIGSSDDVAEAYHRPTTLSRRPRLPTIPSGTAIAAIAAANGDNDDADGRWDSSLGMGVNRKLMQSLKNQAPEDWFMRMVRNGRSLDSQQQQHYDDDIRQQQQREQEQEREDAMRKQRQDDLEKASSWFDDASTTSTSASTHHHSRQPRQSTDTIFEDLHLLPSMQVSGGSPRSSVVSYSGTSDSMMQRSGSHGSSIAGGTRPVKLQKGRRKYWRSKSALGATATANDVALEVRQDADDPYFLAVKVDMRSPLTTGHGGSNSNNDNNNNDADDQKEYGNDDGHNYDYHSDYNYHHDYRRDRDNGMIGLLEVYVAQGPGWYDQELWHMPPRPLYESQSDLLLNMKRAFQYFPDGHFFARVRSRNGKVLTNQALDGIVTFPTHYST